MRYEIATLNDMLKVPADRRAAMLLDLAYALDLHEVAFGEEAADTPLHSIWWEDDGLHNVQITDQHGAEILSLEVTPAEPKQSAAQAAQE